MDIIFKLDKSDAFNGRIKFKENVMMGKPVIKNTRIPVEQILRKLSQAISVDELLDDYPNLSREDINAALKYDADCFNGEERQG